jgi:hypothetical protein
VFLFSPYLIHAARFPILPLLISVTIFRISDSDRLLWGSLLRGFFLHFGSFFSILKDWSVKLFQDKTDGAKHGGECHFRSALTFCVGFIHSYPI